MRRLADLDSCDVSDKESLAVYRKNILVLQEMLNGEDMHSLLGQFLRIRFKFTLFKTFFESISLTIPEYSTDAGYENSIVSLLRESFFEAHIMAVRRLIDDHDYNPKRSVYSVLSFLRVIEDNIEYFTRENYVCYNGLPYSGGDHSFGSLSDLTESANLQFDFLCGKTKRDRKDKLQKSVIGGLAKKIERLSKVRYYANKYYAHASNPLNRDPAPERNQISLLEMEEHLKTIESVLLGCGKLVASYVPTELSFYPGNLIENWERPAISPDNIIPVLNYWDNERKETRDSAEKLRAVDYLNWESEKPNI
jgi:hypothetical protein